MSPQTGSLVVAANPLLAPRVATDREPSELGYLGDVLGGDHRPNAHSVDVYQARRTGKLRYCSK
jgi:hypothetical protein